MVLYDIAFISDWSIGFYAWAVSRKTPIYFIDIYFINSLLSILVPHSAIVAAIVVAEIILE